MSDVDTKNPFAWLQSINFDKNDLIKESNDPSVAEKDYNAFMVNRGLSLFSDTIFHALQMTTNWSLENRLQYDFLRNSIRKRKRYSKWFKPEKNEDIEVIMKAYKYSHKKAEEVLPLFTPAQLRIMKDKMSEGGTNKK